jgi:hypothetical protein
VLSRFHGELVLLDGRAESAEKPPAPAATCAPTDLDDDIPF